MCHKISLHLSNAHKYEGMHQLIAPSPAPFLYTRGTITYHLRNRVIWKWPRSTNRWRPARNFSQGFGRKGGDSPKKRDRVPRLPVLARRGVRQAGWHPDVWIPPSDTPLSLPFIRPHTAGGASPKQRRKKECRTRDAGKKGLKKQSTQTERSAEQG